MKINRLLKIIALILLNLGAIIIVIDKVNYIYNYGMNLNKILDVIFVITLTTFLNYENTKK